MDNLSDIEHIIATMNSPTLGQEYGYEKWHWEYEISPEQHRKACPRGSLVQTILKIPSRKNRNMITEICYTCNRVWLTGVWDLAALVDKDCNRKNIHRRAMETYRLLKERREDDRND